MCHVAVAQQNADFRIVGDYKVHLVVAVEIAHGDESCPVRRRRRYGRLKSAVAIAEEDADAIGIGSHHNI